MHQIHGYPPDEFRVEGRVSRDTLNMMTRTFFSEVKQQTGSYCYRGFLWHAFSYGYQSALERNDAVSAFEKCDDTELYVYDEELDMLWLCPRLIVNSHTHPCKDTYIFPANFNWLYITTHENARGIGPYFVRVSSGQSECG